MKAMILAAGRGERMKPLTDSLPKPLLEVAGKPLLQHHIEALARAGIRDIVINHARMGELIEKRFGDGQALQVCIEYSAEGDEPLETGGGIKRAMAMLGDNPFIVANADVFTDFDYAGLPGQPDKLAHLVMVPNPAHNPQGDFELRDGLLRDLGRERYTFSGIAVYCPALFDNSPQGSFPLAPLLREAMAEAQVSGELYEGTWVDVGTPQRLEEINHRFSK